MENIKKSILKKWWFWVIMTFVVFILSLGAAFGFYVLSIINDQDNQLILNTPVLDNEKLAIVQGKNNYWLGTSAPQLTIVEFADFACSSCKDSFPNIREIGIKYQDRVKIIFRDYPVSAGYSAHLALAARCAGEQGLFWVMHDKLFLNQGISDDSQIYELAKQIGADTARFSACYKEQKYLPQIDQDFKDGQTLGLEGTPTWFFNGQMVAGNIPHDTFISMVESLLTN